MIICIFNKIYLSISNFIPKSFDKLIINVCINLIYKNIITLHKVSNKTQVSKT